MKLFKNKHIIILLLSVFIFNSCRSKKVFNGTSTLKCAEYEEPLKTKEKKNTKWRLVLYKDGSRVGGKAKRGKSRLFKKKN
tara:strand:+ start:4423 stop:4665 length:243 start_codon:yes stop_codon:yes gene_type:complete